MIHLITFIKELIQQDASNLIGKEEQQDLHGLVSEILHGSSDLADSSGTHSVTRERIFEESEELKMALQNLINEYGKHVSLST